MLFTAIKSYCLINYYFIIYRCMKSLLFNHLKLKTLNPTILQSLFNQSNHDTSYRILTSFIVPHLLTDIYIYIYIYKLPINQLLYWTRITLSCCLMQHTILIYLHHDQIINDFYCWPAILTLASYIHYKKGFALFWDMPSLIHPSLLPEFSFSTTCITLWCVSLLVDFILFYSLHSCKSLILTCLFSFLVTFHILRNFYCILHIPLNETFLNNSLSHLLFWSFLSWQYASGFIILLSHSISVFDMPLLVKLSSHYWLHLHLWSLHLIQQLHIHSGWFFLFYQIYCCAFSIIWSVILSIKLLGTSISEYSVVTSFFTLW